MLGSHNKHFENYNRIHHRYKLGKETIIDCLLLSNSDILLHTVSNVSSFAVVISKKNKKNMNLRLI